AEAGQITRRGHRRSGDRPEHLPPPFRQTGDRVVPIATAGRRLALELPGRAALGRARSAEQDARTQPAHPPLGQPARAGRSRELNAARASKLVRPPTWQGTEEATLPARVREGAARAALAVESADDADHAGGPLGRGAHSPRQREDVPRVLQDFSGAPDLGPGDSAD